MEGPPRSMGGGAASFNCAIIGGCVYDKRCPYYPICIIALARDIVITAEFIEREAKQWHRKSTGQRMKRVFRKVLRHAIFPWDT